MTSWQTRPAAGVAVVGIDRQGSNLTISMTRSLISMCIERTFSYSFLPKAKDTGSFRQMWAAWVRNYFHTEHYFNILTK